MSGLKVRLHLRSPSPLFVAETVLSPLQEYTKDKTSWDDWVPQDRLRKLTDENKELAQSLKRELDAARRPIPKSIGTGKRRTQGSDIGSGRGSEERPSSQPAGGRGTKRNRDYDIEKVGSSPSSTTSPSSSSGGRPGLQAQTVNPYNSTFKTGAGIGRNYANRSITNGPVNARPRRRRRSAEETVSEPVWKQKRVRNMTAEEILSELPPDPIDLVTKRWAPLLSGTVPGCYGGPQQNDQLTPERAKGYRNRELSNEPKRIFFEDQKSKQITMIADRSGKALHPLKFPPTPVIEHDNNSCAPVQEETFHNRPSVRIVVPDVIKAHLVDDWENVTKNLQLVPIPSKVPVNHILDTYFDAEKKQRRLGSPEADLLEEVVAGVKEYFDLSLGRILLYRFEREQFSEIRKLWEGGDPQWEGKGPGDAYGAEHLSRLFGRCSQLLHCLFPDFPLSLACLKSGFSCSHDVVVLL